MKKISDKRLRLRLRLSMWLAVFAILIGLVSSVWADLGHHQNRLFFVRDTTGISQARTIYFNLDDSTYHAGMPQGTWPIVPLLVIDGDTLNFSINGSTHPGWFGFENVVVQTLIAMVDTSITLLTDSLWVNTFTDLAGVTNLDTVNISDNVVIADDKFFGLGTGKGQIAFDDQSMDIFSVLNADMYLGALTATDQITPDFKITGDADTDGTTTNETITWALNGASDPTAAYWGITSTQSAGYVFDKPITTGANGGTTGQLNFVASDNDQGSIAWNTADQEVHTGASGGIISYSNINPGAADTYTLGASAAWNSAYISDNLCVGGKGQTASIYVSQEVEFANTDSSIKIFVNAGVPTISGAATDGDISTVTWNTSDQIVFSGAGGGYDFQDGNLIVGSDAGDQEMPSFILYGDADSDASATDIDNLVVKMVGANDPANSYWSFDAADNRSFYFAENVGIGAMASTANLTVRNVIRLTANSEVSATDATLDFYTQANRTLGSQIIGSCTNTGELAFYTGNGGTLGLYQNYQGKVGLGTTVVPALNSIAGTTPIWAMWDSDAEKTHATLAAIDTGGGLISAESAAPYIKIGGIGTIDQSIPIFSIRGDADSDGSAITSEAMTWTLTANADPALAKWAVTSTQGVGYSFDKAITAPTSSNTINSLIINAGALSGITTLGMNNQLTNTLEIGTAPFVITSTTVNANLNADMIDGYHLDQNVLTTSDVRHDSLHLTDDFTIATGKNIKVGAVTWTVVDSIDGEIIAANTIDDDALDLADITLADFTDDVGYEEETHASEHAISGDDAVFPADPGADRILMWDDAPTGELVWLDYSAWDVSSADDMLKADFGDSLAANDDDFMLIANFGDSLDNYEGFGINITADDDIEVDTTQVATPYDLLNFQPLDAALTAIAADSIYLDGGNVLYSQTEDSLYLVNIKVDGIAYLDAVSTQLIQGASPITLDVTGTGNSYFEIIQDNNAGYLAVGRTTATEPSMLSITDGGADNEPGQLQLYADDGNANYFWVSTTSVFRAQNSPMADDDAGGYAIVDLTDGTIGAIAQPLAGASLLLTSSNATATKIDTVKTGGGVVRWVKITVGGSVFWAAADTNTVI